jgi:hypothetical protein
MVDPVVAQRSTMQHHSSRPCWDTPRSRGRSA